MEGEPILKHYVVPFKDRVPDLASRVDATCDLRVCGIHRRGRWGGVCCAMVVQYNAIG